MELGSSASCLSLSPPQNANRHCWWNRPIAVVVNLHERLLLGRQRCPCAVRGVDALVQRAPSAALDGLLHEDAPPFLRAVARAHLVPRLLGTFGVALGQSAKL